MPGGGDGSTRSGGSVYATGRPATTARNPEPASSTPVMSGSRRTTPTDAADPRSRGERERRDSNPRPQSSRDSWCRSGSSSRWGPSGGAEGGDLLVDLPGCVIVLV